LVGWTGSLAVALADDRILAAYSAECGSPAVFQTCYSVFDSAGNVLYARLLRFGRRAAR
jgi:hypothetical protein